MMVLLSGAPLTAPARPQVAGTDRRPSVMMEVSSIPSPVDGILSLLGAVFQPEEGASQLLCSPVPSGPQALALTSASRASVAGYCPNPGIPIGTRKVGINYRLEDRVTYYCSRGLTLRGSQQRTCQEGGSWSGTEPSCQGDACPMPSGSDPALSSSCPYPRALSSPCSAAQLLPSLHLPLERPHCGALPAPKPTYCPVPVHVSLALPPP